MAMSRTSPLALVCILCAGLPAMAQGRYPSTRDVEVQVFTIPEASAGGFSQNEFEIFHSQPVASFNGRLPSDGFNGGPSNANGYSTRPSGFNFPANEFSNGLVSSVPNNGYSNRPSGFISAPANEFTSGWANSVPSSPNNRVSSEFGNVQPNGGEFSVQPNSGISNEGFNNAPFQNFAVGNIPFFEYFNPYGVRLTFPGPYEQTSVYRVKYSVSVNQGVNGINGGQYNGEVSISSGNSVAFTIPNLMVKHRDTIHYMVEVEGTQGRRTWTRTHRGTWPINENNPHGSQPSYTSNVRPQTQTQVQTSKPSSGSNSNQVPHPLFQYFNPRGVRVTLQGSYEPSSSYQLKYSASVNQGVSGINSGQYNGEVNIPGGNSLTFTMPNMKVKHRDTVYYIVEVQGTQGSRTWTRTLRGTYPINENNPHGSQPSYVRPQTEVKTTTTQRPRPTVGSNKEEVKDPIFEYFDPRGVKMSLQGPYRESNVYLLKYHVNINKGFNNVKAGQYNGEVTIPRGQPWSFTIPDLRVDYFDIIHYWVEIQGQQGRTTWIEEYKGYWQVPERDPHGSGTPLESPTTPEQRPEPVYTPPPTYTYPPTTTTPTTRYTPPRTTYTYPRTTTTPTTRYTPPRTTYTFPPTTTTTTPPPRITTPPTYTPPTTTTTTTRRPQVCKKSSTTFNNGKRPCSGKPMVDNFEFNSVEQIGGTEPEDSFTVFSKDSVLSSGLRFKSVFPSLLEEKYGDNFVDQGLTLPGCTSLNPALCSANATSYFILPPIVSGRQSTEDSLHFKYGILEVTAKLPSGDWVVPELWLMPRYRVYGVNSGKIVLAKCRGNRQLHDGVQDHSSQVLEAGVQIGSKSPSLYRSVIDKPWTDDYHKFALSWTPDELVFYVDNKEIGRTVAGPNGLDPSLRGSSMAPFDEEFYLVYGVHVGGDKDFPDGLIDKPWKNFEPKNKLNFWRKRNKWHPTWSSDTALHIRDIRLTSLNY